MCWPCHEHNKLFQNNSCVAHTQRPFIALPTSLKLELRNSPDQNWYLYQWNILELYQCWSCEERCSGSTKVIINMYLENVSKCMYCRGTLYPTIFRKYFKCIQVLLQLQSTLNCIRKKKNYLSLKFTYL